MSGNDRTWQRHQRQLSHERAAKRPPILIYGSDRDVILLDDELVCEFFDPKMSRRYGHLFAASQLMLAALQAVEWGGLTDDDCNVVPACPFCDAAKTDGHADGCELAAALSKATGAK